MEMASIIIDVPSWPNAVMKALQAPAIKAEGNRGERWRGSSEEKFFFWSTQTRALVIKGMFIFFKSLSILTFLPHHVPVSRKMELSLSLPLHKELRWWGWERVEWGEKWKLIPQWAETVWNRRIHFRDKNLFPMSSGASEWASEWVSEWVQWSARMSEQMSTVERNKQISERRELTNEQTSEWPSTISDFY